MARRFVAAVQSEYSTAEVLLVAHARVADYWRCWPDVDLIVYDPSAGRLAAMWRTAAALRARGPFDSGYLLTPSLSSAVLFAMAGIDRRIGFASDARGWLLAEPYRYSFGRSRLHLSEQYLTLLGPNSRGTGNDSQNPNWFQSDAKSVDGRLEALGLGSRRFVVAAVGTEGEAKRYPAEAWIGAIRLMAASESVICVGTTREQVLTDRIVSAVGEGVYDWSGQTNLGELATLLQRASGFVGADSGAAHLAASLGAPTVVIFGPGDPVEVAPQGRAVTVLREPLWCSPCGQSKCPRRDHPRECLDLVSPSRVAQTVLGCLKSSS